MKTYQSNALNLSCKQNKLHDLFEKASIRKTNKQISITEVSLFLFLWGKTGDNNDRKMNTRNNPCQRATSFFVE